MISGPSGDTILDDDALAATLRAERECRAGEPWKPLADLWIQVVRMFVGEQLVLVEVAGGNPRGSITVAGTCRKARHWQATVSDGFDLFSYPHR